MSWHMIYLVLFASAVFAALQNVTIDDAASTGAVIPQYLPFASSWNQGNNCSKCLAKPDPSRAYNGTWHDTTFKPNSGTYQAIQFTFVGSALYIYFILANTVPSTITLTNVIFYLDGIAVGTFSHTPSTCRDYEYNVPVYVNESLAFGEHNMTIKPVSSKASMLMLFDYFIYTTDTDITTTSSTMTPSATLSPTSLGGSSDDKNTAAIIGGTVGGAAALLLVVASLLYYWKYKRRKRSQLLPLQNGESHGVLGSLAPLSAVTACPMPSAGTIHTYHMQSHLSAPEPESARLAETLRPPSPPISINPPSTASLYSNNAALLEQLEIVREEILLLRRKYLE